MSRMLDEFGSMVFGDREMQQRLPEDIYLSLRETIEKGSKLNHGVSAAVAAAMKDWALEHGATHYTHWFQPMTGVTAEKHDSFLSFDKSGCPIEDFSGKELKQGEPDASSFPSGGLRATFEARGYTAWDPTSYAFIKDGTLCIPTVFCSYGGESLDKKTPLLRSMEALNKQALRILKLFGNTDVKRVVATVGAEQEYFLVDKDLYDRRKDLVYTGRTLFGARPPKGQELDDHYSGSISPRVKKYMEELDWELWHLGIYAKTEHNETAPAQHELAPLFANANIATDNNSLMMEIMKKVALRNNLVCILHEKPFEGVNGSGKHNNWSIATDDGQNLLAPGETPFENAQFLLFLVATIAGVDEYQDLLRVSVASASNDCRLGANEAPPAIISMFLGEQLTEILDAIKNENDYTNRTVTKMQVGVTSLPSFSKDVTDRNRTSPFAFTGNKFEFRMPGSTLSIAGPNLVLNTIVAEELSRFADRLEQSSDFTNDLHALIKETIIAHERIIFNGNNYAEEWVAEAERRGLSNLRTTADSLPEYRSARSIALFERHGIFTEAELLSRCEILTDNYCKVLNIEALTMLDMARREILPAAESYSGMIAETAAAKKAVGVDTNPQILLLLQLSRHISDLYSACEELDHALLETKHITDSTELSFCFRDRLLPLMENIRASADALETIVGESYWPFPTYGELLFNL